MEFNIIFALIILGLIVYFIEIGSKRLRIALEENGVKKAVEFTGAVRSFEAFLLALVSLIYFLFFL